MKWYILPHAISLLFLELEWNIPGTDTHHGMISSRFRFKRKVIEPGGPQITTPAQGDLCESERI